jgi:hypothetical protein
LSKLAGFEAITAMVMKRPLFWDTVMPCSPLGGTRRFHAQGSKVSQTKNQPDRTALRYIAQDRTRAIIIIIIIIAVVLRKTILFNGHEKNGISVSKLITT